VTVLATSRQPLDVPGEHTCLIPPLPVDAEPGGAGGDAVELFAQRAAAAVPGFTVGDENRGDVARICRRLDGIPLAIELATVRLRALPLGQLADRLESRFRVLSGGLRTALPRHTTLRTAIEWSHDLCTWAERLLWARLSVFAGSFNLAAAEEVCADAGLDRDDITEALIGLVDKSVLLREEGDGSTRYRLLDTLREFGAERLAGTGQEPEFRARHLDYYLAIAEQFDRDPMTDQLARYHALRREHANIRAALEASLALPGRDRDAARLAVALNFYWAISYSGPEAGYWLHKIIERFSDPSLERAQVLLLLCNLQVGHVDAGEEGIAIAERLGAEALAARGHLYLTQALLQDPSTRAEARRVAAIAEKRLRAVGDQFALLNLQVQLASQYGYAGEPELAIARCHQGLRLAAGTGDVWMTSYLHLFLGFALFQQDKNQASGAALCRALTMKYELDDDLGLANTLEIAAWLAVRRRRYERGAWLLGAAGALWESPGDGQVEDYPYLREPHRNAVQPARDALGTDRYTALYQAGYGYPLDQLVPLMTEDADQLPQPSTSAGPDANGADADPLTSREREIAALVAEGLSNRAIAERLVISKRTVDAHVEHIYTKLGISSRVQLSNWLKP